MGRSRSGHVRRWLQQRREAIVALAESALLEGFAVSPINRLGKQSRLHWFKTKRYRKGDHH